jgi:hypothetical protein
MSWLSSRWAPGGCAGLHAVFETLRLDKKAYNCQLKVNAPVILAKKRIFEAAAKQKRPGKTVVSRDGAPLLKKMNRVNRKP